MTKPTLTLDEIRKSVSRIDKEILALLTERRELSIEVAKSKIQTEKPVRDPVREQALLEKLVKAGKEHGLDAPYIISIFHSIIEDSVLIQQAFLQQLTNPDSSHPVARVSFLGPKGSYSYLAAKHFFTKKQTSLAELPCQNFKEVVEVVENGTADYGVLPIENTSSGSINDVYDQLQHTRLSIVGEITQPIEHCILTAVDTDLESIDCLYSHPQPYQQCSDYLRSLGNVKQEYCSSTAEAMKKVAEMKSANVAAIGNASSAALYGLKPLKANIANQQENHTRFILVARNPVDVTDLIPAKTTFIMSTAQEAGSLVECLLVFRNHGINMTKLESRPVMGNPWEEMFYVDVEGNMRSDKMKLALEELTALTRYIKVLGCYPIENVTPTEIDVD
ncbi:prephenate dehydratase [Veronia pacifica]|uniref:Bifunctional chorismate mutase/prephenate dehydratase n=1 Tax=Veronia pacifica TaxID=1080227 RepID=A0A1C3EB80_9GAMM|nr:prephenate dehydratase [Veronia pacifica]ODA30489.1 chorismate mutase [Veronia pacifica]